MSATTGLIRALPHSAEHLWPGCMLAFFVTPAPHHLKAYMMRRQNDVHQLKEANQLQALAPK
jgi:hypothetical protein